MTNLEEDEGASTEGAEFGEDHAVGPNVTLGSVLAVQYAFNRSPAPCGWVTRRVGSVLHQPTHEDSFVSGLT